jgi:hypothetical protein
MGWFRDLAEDFVLGITNPREHARKTAEQVAHYEAQRELQLEEQRIAAEKAAGHKGGWHNAIHVDIEGHPVTIAFGWGSKENECLMADGHVDTSWGSDFYRWKHDHYGSGKGANQNGTRRGYYTGPGHDD